MALHLELLQFRQDPPVDLLYFFSRGSCRSSLLSPRGARRLVTSGLLSFKSLHKSFIGGLVSFVHMFTHVPSKGQSVLTELDESSSTSAGRGGVIFNSRPYASGHIRTQWTVRLQVTMYNVDISPNAVVLGPLGPVSVVSIGQC